MAHALGLRRLRQRLQDGLRHATLKGSGRRRSRGGSAVLRFANVPRPNRRYLMRGLGDACGHALWDYLR
jgi:hypothetical protein